MYIHTYTAVRTYAHHTLNPPSFPGLGYVTQLSIYSKSPPSPRPERKKKKKEKRKEISFVWGGVLFLVIDL